MTPIRNHTPHRLQQIGLNLIQDLHQALGEEVLVKIGGNVLGMHLHSHLFLVVIDMGANELLYAYNDNICMTPP